MPMIISGTSQPNRIKKSLSPNSNTVTNGKPLPDCSKRSKNGWNLGTMKTIISAVISSAWTSRPAIIIRFWAPSSSGVA